MTDPEKIVKLIDTHGITRVYQMEDGATETREGGTVSWRNNNPGNLKFAYQGGDPADNSTRSQANALAAAQGRYSGVVALDQWGNAVFETPAAGQAARAQLLKDGFGEKTIPEMLKKYAVSDYSGTANHDAYAKSLYAEGDRQGVDLRGKKIGDLKDPEFKALLDGMQTHEGFKEGTVSRTPPVQQQGTLNAPPAQGAPSAPSAPGLSGEQLALQRMAATSIDKYLGGQYTPEQLEKLSLAAVALAEGSPHAGPVKGFLVSKDGGTIAARYENATSEFQVSDALAKSSGQITSEINQPPVLAAQHGGLTEPHIPARTR